MYTVLSILAGSVAAYFYVPGFFDLPLGLLTLRDIFAEMLCALFAFLALAAFSWSVEKDGIWPWNWHPRTGIGKG